MPPAISDEENSESDVALSSASAQKRARDNKKPTRYSKAKEGSEDDEDMVDAKDMTNGREPDEDGAEIPPDDDESAEEYVVEKIMDHRFEGGTLKFEVKWEGYEKKSDRTWEPEDHLKENASNVLEEYFERVGGRDKIVDDMRSALKNKKRGRSQTNSVTNTPTSKRNDTNKRARRADPHPSESTPPASIRDARETKADATSTAWRPPTGSWEDEISTLDACEDEETGKLMVYLTWKNGRKTQHETSVVYKRCPQKMLQFYERHVRIIKKDPEEQSANAWPKVE